jgi:phenylacetic acid degradation operon negative regulatory protein
VAGDIEETGLLERPLAPRSLVASLLLGTHPPRLPGALLVRWCGLFGVAEGTTRVALSRMVDRGELVHDDGAYTLAGDVRARQAPQDWSLHPQLVEPWTGEWRLAVVHLPARAAPERARLRAAARRLRLIELREGVWGRPHNLPPAADPDDARRDLERQTLAFTAYPHFDTAELIARFGAEEWAARARRLAERVEHERRRLDARAPERFPAVFEAGAAALQHVRSDPLLPREIVGARWPGPALRAAYLRYQPAFSSALAEWFRGVRAEAVSPGGR